MVMTLLDALKESPSFFNIGITQLQEAVLSSEEQTYRQATSRDEYVYFINEKIKKIKAVSKQKFEFKSKCAMGPESSGESSMYNYQPNRRAQAPQQYQEGMSPHADTKSAYTTKVAGQQMYIPDHNRQRYDQTFVGHDAGAKHDPLGSGAGQHSMHMPYQPYPHHSPRQGMGASPGSSQAEVRNMRASRTSSYGTSSPFFNGQTAQINECAQFNPQYQQSPASNIPIADPAVYNEYSANRSYIGNVNNHRKQAPAACYGSQASLYQRPVTAMSSSGAYHSSLYRDPFFPAQSTAEKSTKGAPTSMGAIRDPGAAPMGSVPESPLNFNMSFSNSFITDRSMQSAPNRQAEEYSGGFSSQYQPKQAKSPAARSPRGQTAGKRPLGPEYPGRDQPAKGMQGFHMPDEPREENSEAAYQRPNQAAHLRAAHELANKPFGAGLPERFSKIQDSEKFEHHAGCYTGGQASSGPGMDSGERKACRADMQYGPLGSKDPSPTAAEDPSRQIFDEYKDFFMVSPKMQFEKRRSPVDDAMSFPDELSQFIRTNELSLLKLSDPAGWKRDFEIVEAAAQREKVSGRQPGAEVKLIEMQRKYIDFPFLRPEQLSSYIELRRPKVNYDECLQKSVGAFESMKATNSNATLHLSSENDE